MKLDKKQLDTINATVQFHGHRRKMAQPDFNQADFIAGAMTVFFSLGLQMQIPAGWLFGTMAEDMFPEPNPEIKSKAIKE